ncbi:hypothetical protein COHA_003949 [Chlorella ohadii]|uniref:Peptide deformylase n=1 Tax=Chlorella ohadii TaxID=2649997 RepID=A0AAD5DXU3_9CHLO|nr:hypothetical protein COHA_003949 [Chlorella ohadii]
MAAVLARPAPVAALARPLSRCSSKLAAAWTAPWPQRRPQAPERDARVAARNRLAELLQDMRKEETEEELNVPVVTNLEWQSPLSVVRYPDPRLRAQNARIGAFDDTLRRLAEEMFEVMYQDDGVGLAAPQVGVNVRLMVFNESGVKGKGEEIVLVNPQLLSLSGNPKLFEEGCLSFPNIYADVERPARVRVKAQDLKGKTFTLSLNGFVARIFQHEYDHLDGKLFHDRMAPPVLDSIRQQLVELEEEYLREHPDAQIQRVQ